MIEKPHEHHAFSSQRDAIITIVRRFHSTYSYETAYMLRVYLTNIFFLPFIFLFNDLSFLLEKNFYNFIYYFLVHYHLTKLMNKNSFNKRVRIFLLDIILIILRILIIVALFIWNVKKKKNWSKNMRTEEYPIITNI